MIELPGIRRISFAEYLDGVRPEPGEAYWLDQCLYDIDNTTRMAVVQAYREGAKAVTLHWSTPIIKSYRCVMETCKDLNMIIVLCYEDFHREVYQWPSTQD